MLDRHFLSATARPATHADVFGPLQGGERGLWQGRCAVAEYAFDEAASLPRWALPETTEVLVTDRRVLYAYTRSDSPDDLEVTSGELRWLWPQHLRVQPGARTAGRAAAAAQIQLVCAASDGSFPALVFAGGDLQTVADADRLANLMRHSIARFRVDNAAKLGLSTPQSRMLSRLLIGPEFSNYQGGEGQTVSLLGALAVHRPATPEPPAEPPQGTQQPEYAPPAEYAPHAEHAPQGEYTPHAEFAPQPEYTSQAEHGPHAEFAPQGEYNPQAEFAPHAEYNPQDEFAPQDEYTPQAEFAPQAEYAPAREPVSGGEPQPYDPGRAAVGRGATQRLPGYRPGLAADEARALQAAAAEQATQLTQPDLAFRAADIAARVADLVAAAEERAAAEQAAAEQAAAQRAAAERAAAEQEAAEQEADQSEVPTTDLTARAANVRRAAARFAANSARGKAGVRRPESEIGTTSRGNRSR